MQIGTIDLTILNIFIITRKNVDCTLTCLVKVLVIFFVFAIFVYLLLKALFYERCTFLKCLRRTKESNWIVFFPSQKKISC